MVYVSGAAKAQIYVGEPARPEDSVALSNYSSETTPRLLIDAPAPEPSAEPVALSLGPDGRMPNTPAPARHADRLIAQIAREFSVSASLVRAVVAVESGFNPRARSRKGALGLMQLMPETARRFGVTDPFSEEQNLRGGTAYLRWLLDAFSGDVALALAAYNAGEAAVIRAGHRIPNYAETRAYVPKVLAYQQRYADSGFETLAQR